MKRKSTRPAAKKRSTTETSAKAPAARAPAARSAKPTSARRTAAKVGQVGQTSGRKPGTERSRDEQRTSGGPRYAGGPWQVAEERGERRYGHARTDDADPSELRPGETDIEEDDRPTVSDEELASAEASAEIESGGQRRGMRRGDEPRGVKSRGR